MRNWFALPVRATEATPEQLVATGALVGGYGRDPVDGDTGYKPAGLAGRTVPYWTAEKGRTYSVAAYRSNPMARAIVDTYTSFCCGDKGLSLQVTNPVVRAIAEEFWTDSRNQLDQRQDLMLRHQLLMGELILELMVGQVSGVVRFSPIDAQALSHVDLLGNNPLWPDKLWIRSNIDAIGGRSLDVAQVNDLTGLREGNAIFWAPWRALLTDTRGEPFLMPILDWLDSYDQVLSNLIDRTALARYFAFDVTVAGGKPEVDAFVSQRGGTHVPPSGSVEVHNESVTWKPMSATTGAFEDSQTNLNVLTQISAGAGLAKHWLAEPEQTNRATSLTMAEPVRRRVSGVQQIWLNQMTEFVRFAVDRAVASRRIPRTVDATDPQSGITTTTPASQAVRVTGPEIAAADAQVNATVLMNLSTALMQMTETGVLSPEAARVAAKKAWEDYVGVPYVASLDSPEANPDDVATHIDASQPPAPSGQPLVQITQPATEAKTSVAGVKGAEKLHHYWTREPDGLAKWADSDTPWTDLRDHLLKFMDPDEAKRTATNWFHDVFGFYPGSDANRVAHGKPPRGKVIGPG